MTDLGMAGETIGVIRPTADVDAAYNEATLTYGAEPTHMITGCAFDPGGSTEDNDGRTAVATTPTLYLPAGADLVASDQVIVRGDRFAVVGKPARWTDPFDGTPVGVVANLEEVAG